MTFRCCARFIGFIIWHQHLSLQPMVFICHILNLAQRIGKEVRDAGGRQAWDNSFTLSQEELDHLTTVFDEVCKNPWISMRKKSTLRRVYVVTDSSNRRYGSLIWDEQRKLTQEDSAMWDAQLRDAHIFVKELKAAQLGILQAIKLFGESIDIVIATDNTAAAHVLERGWSTTAVGQKILAYLLGLMRRHKCEMSVMTVRSEDNPADEPSRGRAVNPERVFRFWQLVDMFEHGFSHRTAQPAPFSLKRPRQLRHDENEMKIAEPGFSPLTPSEDGEDAAQTTESPFRCDDELCEVMFGLNAPNGDDAEDYRFF